MTISQFLQGLILSVESSFGKLKYFSIILTRNMNYIRQYAVYYLIVFLNLRIYILAQTFKGMID